MTMSGLEAPLRYRPDGILVQTKTQGINHLDVTRHTIFPHHEFKYNCTFQFCCSRLRCVLGFDLRKDSRCFHVTANAIDAVRKILFDFCDR